MANYSLILKMIADDKDFKTGFDNATKVLDRHIQKVHQTGNSYASMNKTLENFKSIARNAFLEFGRGSDEFKRATSDAKAYQRQLQKVNNEMAKQGLAGNAGSLSGKGLGSSIMGVAMNRIAPLVAIAGAGQALRDTYQTIEGFNVKMSTLRAVTNASGDEMNAFASSALKARTNVPALASEVADLQIEMAKLGLTAPEILKATDAVIYMSVAGMVPLGQAAEVAASTMKAFGLQASDIARIADVMAMSFNVSAMDMERFSTSMAIVSPAAKAAGYSFEFATSALAVLIDRGMDASMAGTSLRNVFLKVAADGLSLGKVMDEIEASTNKLATAQKYFETRTASAAVVLAGNRDVLVSFLEKMHEARGAAEDMSRVISDNLTGDLKKLQSAWQSMLIEIGRSNGVIGKTLREMTMGFASSFDFISKIVQDQNVLRGTSIFGGEMKSQESEWGLEIKKRADVEIKAIIQMYKDRKITYEDGERQILEIQKKSSDEQLAEQIKFIERKIASYSKLVEIENDNIEMMRGFGMDEKAPADARKLSVDELSSLQKMKDAYVSLNTTLGLYKQELASINKAQEDADVKKFLEQFGGDGGKDSLTGIINNLEAEIARLGVAMKATLDENEIESYKQQIDNLRERIEILLSAIEKVKIRAPKVSTGAGMEGMWFADDNQELTANPQKLTIPIRQVDIKPVGQKDISTMIDTKQLGMDFIGMGTAQLLEDSIQGIIDASNSGNWDNFGASIKEGMATFLIDFGKMLIMQSTMMAVASALSTNWLTWPLGLAIGASAVALGLLMKGKSPSGGSNGSGGNPISFSPLAGYSKYAARGGSDGSRDTSKSGDIQVEFRIKGEDLVGVIDRQNLKKSSLH